MAVKLQITEENPYPSKLLNYMDYVAVEGMKVFKIPMDITVSCLYLTTEEKKIWYFYLYRFIIIFPIGFMFMVLTMPINILAFALWLTIHKKRKPYRLSYCGTSRRTLEVHKLKRNYGFLTTNVCLMPECMGRFNNFKNSDVRCQKMGEILARKHVTNSKDSHIIDMEEEGVDKNHNKADQNVQSSNILMNNGYSVGSFIHEWSQSSTTIIPEDTGHRVGPDFDVSVLSHMPDVDLILLQEASWDMEYAKTLVSEMHNIYPYVVYDIGMHSYKGNLWVGNSGLMLASKYDILDIRFGLYEQSLPPCWFASKGLLQLKVYLGRSPTGQDVVGYVFNTHLQAYKGTQPIQTLQMNSVLKWTEEFRRETHKPGEIVAFDILGGDFNLDNLSPVDRDVHNHDLFQTYLDVGREKPGSDYDWTKGTELRQILLYEPDVSSPSSLKRVLESPTMMQKYLLDGDINYACLKMATMMARTDKTGKILSSPVGGKRRIDYLLTRKQDQHVKVTGLNAVTALYNLTDHVPMHLSVDISAHKELCDAFVE